MKVNLKGLAAALDGIREGLEPYENEVDHRHGILFTAAECLRQADTLEAEVERLTNALRKCRHDLNLANQCGDEP